MKTIVATIKAGFIAVFQDRRMDNSARLPLVMGLACGGICVLFGAVGGNLGLLGAGLAFIGICALACYLIGHDPL
jgi:hypothetical protein